MSIAVAMPLSIDSNVARWSRAVRRRKLGKSAFSFDFAGPSSGTSLGNEFWRDPSPFWSRERNCSLQQHQEEMQAPPLER